MLLRNTLAIIWIAAVVVIVLCSGGAAVEYTVTQITNDGWYHDHPQINDNGTLVWEGWAGGESYVFLYDGTSTIELGEYPDSNVIPQINNGGYVAWVGWSGTGHEVFLYDGTSTTQLSFSGFLINDSVQINNSGQVVWRLVQFSSIVDSEIFLYDGTDTIQLTDNDCEDRDPQINDNGWVVWRGQNLVQYDIFRYEGTNVRVVANGKEDRDPQMNDNGVVVWETQAAVDSELEMLYSTGTYVGFTNNTYNDAHPQINNDGWVVWQGCVGQTSPTDCDSDWEIFLDPVPGSAIQLTDNATDDRAPQISENGYVVWQGCDGGTGESCNGGDYEIFVYDGTSITQVTDNDHIDYSPQINANGELVWVGGHDIFFAAPCSDDDGDGYYLETGCPEPLDCNDTNENIYPTNSNPYCNCEELYPQGTEESSGAGNCADGIDNDCDGSVDTDPECNGGCSASAAASTLPATLVYGSSDLAKHLAFFLLPVGAVIGLVRWRRRR